MTGCTSFKYTRKNLYLVLLLTLRCMPAFTRGTTYQLVLNVSRVDFQPGWTAIDDATNGRAMAFTKGCHPEQTSKGIVRHIFVAPINLAHQADMQSVDHTPAEKLRPRLYQIPAR